MEKMHLVLCLFLEDGAAMVTQLGLLRNWLLTSKSFSADVLIPYRAVCPCHLTVNVGNGPLPRLSAL
jgi:hypothetical protein